MKAFLSNSDALKVVEIELDGKREIFIKGEPVKYIDLPVDLQNVVDRLDDDLSDLPMFDAVRGVVSARWYDLEVVMSAKRIN